MLDQKRRIVARLTFEDAALFEVAMAARRAQVEAGGGRLSVSSYAGDLIMAGVREQLT